MFVYFRMIKQFFSCVERADCKEDRHVKPRYLKHKKEVKTVCSQADDPTTGGLYKMAFSV